MKLNQNQTKNKNIIYIRFKVGKPDVIGKPEPIKRN